MALENIDDPQMAANLIMISLTTKDGKIDKINEANIQRALFNFMNEDDVFRKRLASQIEDFGVMRYYVGNEVDEEGYISQKSIVESQSDIGNYNDRLKYAEDHAKEQAEEAYKYRVQEQELFGDLQTGIDTVIEYTQKIGKKIKDKFSQGLPEDFSDMFDMSENQTFPEYVHELVNTKLDELVREYPKLTEQVENYKDKLEKNYDEYKENPAQILKDIKMFIKMSGDMEDKTSDKGDSKDIMDILNDVVQKGSVIKDNIVDKTSPIYDTVKQHATSAKDYIMAEAKNLADVLSDGITSLGANISELNKSIQDLSSSDIFNGEIKAAEDIVAPIIDKLDQLVPESTKQTIQDTVDTTKNLVKPIVTKVKDATSDDIKNKIDGGVDIVKHAIETVSDKIGDSVAEQMSKLSSEQDEDMPIPATAADDIILDADTTPATSSVAPVEPVPEKIPTPKQVEKDTLERSRIKSSAEVIAEQINTIKGTIETMSASIVTKFTDMMTSDIAATAPSKSDGVETDPRNAVLNQIAKNIESLVDLVKTMKSGFTDFIDAIPSESNERQIIVQSDSVNVEQLNTAVTEITDTLFLIHDDMLTQLNNIIPDGIKLAMSGIADNAVIPEPQPYAPFNVNDVMARFKEELKTLIPKDRDGRIKVILPEGKDSPTESMPDDMVSLFKKYFEYRQDVDAGTATQLMDILAALGKEGIGEFSLRMVKEAWGKSNRIVSSVWDGYKRIYGGAFDMAKTSIQSIGNIASAAAPGTMELLKILGSGSVKLGSGTLDLIKNVYSGGWGAVKTGATEIGKSFRSVIHAMRKERPKFVDIYRKGNVAPGQELLTAKRQKEGKCYYASGKVPKSSAEINEPVYDEDEQLLISQDDLDAGLVDVKGHELQETKSRLGGMLLSGAKGLGKAIFGGTGMYAELMKFMFKGGSNILGMGKDMWDKFMGKSLKGKDFANLMDRLNEMKLYLKHIDENTRKKHIFGDTDDDGDRDNSYQDLQQRRKKRKQSRQSAKAAALAMGGRGGYRSPDDEENDEHPELPEEGSSWLGSALKWGGGALLALGTVFSGKVIGSIMGTRPAQWVAKMLKGGIDTAKNSKLATKLRGITESAKGTRVGRILGGAKNVVKDLAHETHLTWMAEHPKYEATVNTIKRTSALKNEATVLRRVKNGTMSIKEATEMGIDVTKNENMLVRMLGGMKRVAKWAIKKAGSIFQYIGKARFWGLCKQIGPLFMKFAKSEGAIKVIAKIISFLKIGGAVAKTIGRFLGPLLLPITIAIDAIGGLMMSEHEIDKDSKVSNLKGDHDKEGAMGDIYKYSRTGNKTFDSVTGGVLNAVDTFKHHTVGDHENYFGLDDKGFIGQQLNNQLNFGMSALNAIAAIGKKPAEMFKSAYYSAEAYHKAHYEGTDRSVMKKGSVNIKLATLRNAGVPEEVITKYLENPSMDFYNRIAYYYIYGPGRQAVRKRHAAELGIPENKISSNEPVENIIKKKHIKEEKRTKEKEKLDKDMLHINKTQLSTLERMANGIDNLSKHLGEVKEHAKEIKDTSKKTLEKEPKIEIIQPKQETTPTPAPAATTTGIPSIKMPVPNRQVSPVININKMQRSTI